MTPEEFARLAEVFRGASERSGQEREAYLDEACGGDGRLRAEIEKLIAREADLETVREQWTDAAEAPLTPTRIGPYRITHQIGRGGSARPLSAASRSRTPPDVRRQLRR